MKAHAWRPWQIEAFERVKDHARIALFMEMRLGKTPVAIRWAHHRTRELTRPRILVVAPPLPSRHGTEAPDRWRRTPARDGRARRCHACPC